jgi:hypothetical protein
MKHELLSQAAKRALMNLHQTKTALTAVVTEGISASNDAHQDVQHEPRCNVVRLPHA